VLALGVGTWVIQVVCACLGLPLAFYARVQALEELRAIAVGRRPASGRKNALLGYWLAQSMIWIWVFTVLLIVALTIIVVPIALLSACN
jgi:hypothetical protein